MRTLLAIALVLAAVARPAAQNAGSQPLAIDLQVVDRDGRPVAALSADKFEVEIAGRRRRVISAELIPAAAAQTAEAQARQQTYFIAVDALSFGAGASQQVVTALKTFLATLPKGSLVGLVTMPGGPAIEQTADHAAIASALDGLNGQRPPQRWGSMGVSAGDVIDYLAASDPTPIVQRFCLVEDDPGCGGTLLQEIMVGVNSLETHMRASLTRLTEFAGRLREIPGRKVLVFVSAGLAVSDRAGARPDVGDLATGLAEVTATSNVALYTLFLDRIADQSRAEPSRQAPNVARDRELQSRWLEQFSTSAGGALVRVQPERPGEADARIARETTTYYRLRVEPADTDSGPRAQRLRIRVDARGASVRAASTAPVRP